jgi:hypothetical protein
MKGANFCDAPAFYQADSLSKKNAQAYCGTKAIKSFVK